MKPETADRGDSKSIEDEVLDVEPSDGAAPEDNGRGEAHALLWSTDDDLPVEPEGAGAGDPADADATQKLRALLNFYMYGKRPAGEKPAKVLPIPALVYPYRDLTRIRYEYPVCLDGFDPETCARPLSDIVDDVLAAAAPEGDEGEQMKRSVYRLESVMRSVTEREPGGRLSVVWERAATSLRSTSELTGKKQEQRREHLKAAREALANDGDLLSCNADTALRLFRTLAVAEWRERSRETKGDVDGLVQDLKDILVTDFQHSDEARSPERLGESLPGELDTAALSEILSHSPQADRLPEARRKRIEGSLAVLERMKPVFDGATDARTPFAVDDALGDCAAAAAEHVKRLQLMVEFFKAVRIARLEASNGYHEDVHDAFFETFDTQSMTEDELALFPPILVHLTEDALAAGGIDALLGIMASGMPAKVLLSLGDVCGAAEGKRARATTGWASRLANMMVALNNVYVLQAPVARFSVMRSGLLAGLRYGGPAFFGVYTAAKQTPDGVPTYLASAAVAESRVLPIFEFNPANGVTLADRMDVSANPQVEDEWTAATVRYLTASGDEETHDVKFTPADFLCLDSRQSRHFWCVEPEQWHADMMPLSDFIELASNKTSTKVPYILAVDDARLLTRVVVTRELVAEVMRAGEYWRILRESGGIDNSFANNLLDRERQRMEEEMQQEIETVEQRYVSQLEQDVGELTREIIQRIANRLIAEDGDTGAAVMMQAAPAAPAPEAPAKEPAVETEAEAPAEAVEEEEEEDLGGMSDPYIDTPLCTTCNECTQLNNQIFAYNADKQAYVKDAAGGPYQDIVRAAELCPVHIIHPGKPKQADVPAEWIKRAEPYN